MYKKKYLLEKLANRKSGYPIATVAYYGPDNLFASKVVVGILASEKDKDPSVCGNGLQGIWMSVLTERLLTK